MSQGTTINHDVESAIETLPERPERPVPPPPPFFEPPFGRDDDGHDDQPEPPVNNARLGIMLFLGAEGMLFAGLLSAFLVFRVGSAVWPPPFQPRLPIVMTALNTVVLLGSGFTMRQALVAIRKGHQGGLTSWLGITALLGVMFLGVQGYEWARLLQYGLTLSSGIYGSTFYTLIGCHALHVFGAVMWLLVVLALATRHRFSAQRHVGVQVCSMYWSFVVALWPVLFVAVYLY